MNARTKTTIILALILFHSATCAFCASAASDPLWQKAVAVARKNSGWVAGLVVMRSQVVYRGETNGVNEIWTRSTLAKEGEVITEIVKVLEDGKDVTEQENKKEKGKTKKANSQAGGGLPFDAANQGRLSLKVTDRSRAIAGRDCVGYSFELQNADGPTARGVAWLEKETGIPAEIEDMTLDPLPDKHLKGLTITTRYESTADGAWRVKEMRTAGKASMMFMKVDVQSTMTFSEYWKKPAKKATTRAGEK